MTNITILTTLEYLGPYGDDDSDANDFVGVTLQVASDANAVPQTDQMLRPWKWTFNPSTNDPGTYPRIRLMYLPAGVTTASRIALVPFEPTRRIGNASANLTAKLDAQFNSLCASGITPGPFGWANPQNTESALTSQTSPTGTAAKIYRWPAQMAQMGRYAYPIPHQLNLSHFLQVSGTLLAAVSPPGGVFIAAPAFVANDIAYEPNLTGISIDFATKIASIPYSSSAGATPSMTVVAQVQPLQPTDCVIAARSTRTPPIAPKDPFVALPQPEDTAWQYQLIPLAAEFFDPAARLIGALRQVIPDLNNQKPPASAALLNILGTKLEPYNTSQLKQYTDCAVYAMQSLADCGGQRSPGTGTNGEAQNGPSLLTRILRVWVAGQPDRNKAAGFEASLLTAVKNYSPLGFSDWLSLLQSVPALSGNSLVSPPISSPSYDSATKALSARLAALENLHLALTQNDVLNAVIVLQWKRFYQSSGASLAQADPDGSLWQSFCQTANEQLKKIDLRQQLAAGNLGSNWNDVLAGMTQATGTAVTSRAALRTGLSSALCTQLTKALAAIPSATFDPSSLLNCLFAKSSCSAAATGTSWVDEQLQTIIQDAPAADAQGQVRRQPTRTSEGITLTVDDLSGQDSPTDDTKDSLRSMSGLCVLARQSGVVPNPSPWRCLNLSVASLDRDGNQVLTPQGTVVPVPLHNQAGLRSTMITYNNRPLMGLSPDMRLGDPIAGKPAVDPKTNMPVNQRLIEYLHPSLLAPRKTSAERKLTGLVFGNSYDFVIGIVRTSCALPAQFSALHDPGSLDLLRQSSKIEDTLKSHGLQGIPYLRTVPIGDLRFGRDLLGFNQDLGLPVIPEGVQPRALDLEPSGEQRRATQPLILLTDFKTPLGQSSIVFNVFKPSIDLRTWDAWAAGDTTLINSAIRAKIWAYFHAQANAQAANGEKADLSLDDLAVDQLDIKLEWLDGGAGSHIPVSWPKNSSLPPISADPSRPQLDLVTWQIMRAGPIQMTIEVSSINPGLVPNGLSGAKLTIPPGSLARLTFTPTLKKDLCEKRFAYGILDDTAMGIPYSFLIETADTGNQNGVTVRALPTEAQLRKALSVELQEDKIKFALDLNAGSPPNKFRNIRSANLRLQAWRWDGRPGTPFPFSKAGTLSGDALDPDVAKWEADTFTTRLISDSDVRALSIDESCKSLSVSEDISTNRGTLYFRYGLEAFNRYGPLVPPEQQSVNSLGSTTAEPQWARYLAPLRWAGPIPKPAVKLVLPLTSSLDSSNKAASLLVVVQGPWYSVGGLAEQMKAELLHVESASSKRWAEAGPDPIRWADSPDTLANAIYSFKDDSPAKFTDSAGNRPTLTTLEGPVGHTFDDTDVNPLFVNCSFVLSPIRSDKHSDTSWDFAKVRFRRIFDADAPGLPSAANNQNLHKESEISSEPTDPFWVQFLPNSDLLHATDSFSTSQATLSSRQLGQDWSFMIRTRTGPITFPTPGKGATIQHFLLLTKLVQDLLGKNNQERFVEIVAQSGDYNTWKLHTDKLKVTDQIVGRVVEVEVRNGTTIGGGETLWNAIFPGDPAVDAGGRIVGISGPIYGSTHQKIGCN